MKKTDVGEIKKKIYSASEKEKMEAADKKMNHIK